MLEADPVYTYTTPGLTRRTAGSPASGTEGDSIYGRYSSVDEGGLDPMRYFESMAVLLKAGVNRRVLQSTQEELAQVLPADHLL